MDDITSENIDVDGISSVYIESVVMPRTKFFLGVYAADNLPENFIGEKFTLICNLDNVGEVGSHFITIIGFPTYVLYLDSLGFSCNVESIKNFLRSRHRNVFYNSVQLQDFSSSFCGFYCILYALYYDKIFDSIVPEEIKFNTSNLLENDMMCIEQIKNLL